LWFKEKKICFQWVNSVASIKYPIYNCYHLLITFDGCMMISIVDLFLLWRIYMNLTIKIQWIYSDNRWYNIIFKIRYSVNIAMYIWPYSLIHIYFVLMLKCKAILEAYQTERLTSSHMFTPTLVSINKYYIYIYFKVCLFIIETLSNTISQGCQPVLILSIFILKCDKNTEVRK